MQETDDSSPVESEGFAQFALDPRILRALDDLGFKAPTPIQSDSLGPILEGRDVIGRARTGSGKTAAFGLPLLELTKERGSHVRALVLAPTRELALQVTEALRRFAKHLPTRVVTIYGGAPYGPQLKALSEGVPIVVGTPGRVLDHVSRGSLDLSHLQMLVLDEADEMLRMGFFEDVERVFASTPPERQVAFFSATMPPPIRRVATAQLRDPLEIQVESAELSVDHIEQRALMVPGRFKTDALCRILAAEPITAALVFTRTREAAANVADELARRGLSVDALHGDLSQGARERVLLRFRAGGLQVVVATDVASRGIDVERISHVINYDLPNDAEQYVHRIGRTGRAGRKGIAISMVVPREAPKLRWLGRTLKVEIAPFDVPTDAAIGAAERGRLVKRILSATEGSATPGVDALLDQLLDVHDERTIAGAVLRLLAEERGLALDADLDDRPPGWARRSRPDTRGGPTDEIELFLPVGRHRGVRPGDLVGALANEIGISGSSIGRITILDRKSFVRVAREAGEQILAHHRSIELRGRAVPISRARPRSAEVAQTARSKEAWRPHRGRFTKKKRRPRGPK